MTEPNNNENYVAGEPVAPAQEPAPQNQPPQYQAPNFQQAPTGDPTFAPADVEAGKMFAILGYIIPILFFLPLVSGVKTPYAMFHANNALIILIGYIVASILSIILIGFLLYIFLFVLFIMGIIAACNGSAKPLPLLGKIVIIK